MPETHAEHFATMLERHFAPLCRRLVLSEATTRVESVYGVASAFAGNVRVFFESERGLCSFGIGEASAQRALLDLESLAERFPRTRLLTEGRQRLNLNEQAAFIQARWQDLQVMFSPEHLRETRAWRQAAGAALTRRHSRDS
jgi:hypothetical protein